MRVARLQAELGDSRARRRLQVWLARLRERAAAGDGSPRSSWLKIRTGHSSGPSGPPDQTGAGLPGPAGLAPRRGQAWYDMAVEPRGQVVKAMVLIRRPHDGALLVSEGVNPAGELFHRPLGGHVEFGEYARDTVHREFAEEVGQALTAVRLAAVLENLFEWGGSAQHEIVFIFTAAFAAEAAYEIEEQHILDTQDGSRVIWRAAGAASPPLYPDSVADLAAPGGEGS
jgi:ADP-ribose pyrophosphatase YjhB (NUDIX family)